MEDCFNEVANLVHKYVEKIKFKNEEEIEMECGDTELAKVHFVIYPHLSSFFA